MEQSKQGEATTPSTNEQPELKPEIASSEQSEYETLLKEAEAKIVKLTSERDNYRTGNNKWRKIAKENQGYVDETSDSLNEDKIGELVDIKVKEALMSSQIAQAVAEKDNLIGKMTRELSEAKIALKNRPPASNTGSGANQDKPEVKTDFFTKDQLEELKNKGIDPNKVIENLRKVQGK